MVKKSEQTWQYYQVHYIHEDASHASGRMSGSSSRVSRLAAMGRKHRGIDDVYRSGSGGAR
eukprot:6352514-Heterocapsa_arctica.AAC.1